MSDKSFSDTHKLVVMIEPQPIGSCFRPVSFVCCRTLSIQ